MDTMVAMLVVVSVIGTVPGACTKPPLIERLIN
jgi:hypothetical protein